MSLPEKFSLRGKTALVTGCRRGIGEAIAVGLAEAGADIIGVSVSLAERPGSVAERVRAAARSFKGFSCDLSDRAALYGFVEKVRAECAPIDILVNNAGIIRRQPAAEHSDAYWDEVVATNLGAQFILARELGRAMVARGSGKIIFVTSLLAFQGGINVPGYAASKGGAGQLTMALANEWAGKGVNVNAIAPGYVATDNTEALRNDPVRQAQILARIPAGRWAAPEDIQGAAVFLASAAADYVHGATLIVDGGWMGR
jgi:2-deoxy-D-gluconate 3-dehydrogenase